MPLYESLDDCQKQAVRKAIRNKSVCIYFEQGVGKSHPTVSIIEELLNEVQQFQGFLVVKLANIETTWVRLLKQNIPQLNIARTWEEFKSLPKPKVFLINYESLSSVDKKFTKFKWTFGCFDESQGLKAKGSRQSRIAGRVKDCEYRLGLSGTPIDGNEIDLFGQLRFIAPQLFGNDRSAWKRFDKQFLKKTGYMGYQRKFRPEKLDEFYELVNPYIIRVYARDVLDLPESTLVTRPVQMLGEQRRVYREMERDLVTRLELEAREREKRTGKKARASAGLKITQMVRLQQICGGFIIDDEGELHSFGSAKLRDLKYVMTRKARYPMVIFHKYTHEGERIELLVKELGYKYGMINGKVKDKKRIKARTLIQDRFQSGELDVIICQVKSGGVGLDLFAGRTAYFYSFTFSWIDFDQCRKRIDRRGQKNKNKIYVPYVENSIDEDLYSIVSLKKSVSKKMFVNIKNRSKKNG